MVEIRMLTTALLAILMCNNCRAQYLHFLPGDAFFQAEITESKLREISDDKTAVILDWGGRDNPRDAIGYRRLLIRNCPSDMRARMMAVYRIIRKDRPALYEIRKDDNGETRIEKNGPLCLVYNEGYDYQLYRLGLRYNESWPEIGGQFGLPPELVSFFPYPSIDGYVPGYVIYDLRFSKRVDGLRVNEPEQKRESAANPLSVDGNAVMFAITQ